MHEALGHQDGLPNKHPSRLQFSHRVCQMKPLSQGLHTVLHAQFTPTQPCTGSLQIWSMGDYRVDVVTAFLDHNIYNGPSIL